MVEGGGVLHGTLIEAGLVSECVRTAREQRSPRNCEQVNELHMYIGACTLGGSALPWLAKPLASTITEVGGCCDRLATRDYSTLDAVLSGPTVVPEGCA